MTLGADEPVGEEKAGPWPALNKDQGSTNKHPRSRTQAPGHQIRHPTQEPGPKPEPEGRILTPEPGPRSRIQLPSKIQEPVSGIQSNIKTEVTRFQTQNQQEPHQDQDPVRKNRNQNTGWIRDALRAYGTVADIYRERERATV